jgi:hypothetical protein
MSPRRSSRARDRPQAPAPRGPSPAAAAARAERERARCEGKQWFETEAEARSIALMHRTQWGEDRVAYACTICGGWHLASR